MRTPHTSLSNEKTLKPLHRLVSSSGSHNIFIMTFILLFMIIAPPLMSILLCRIAGGELMYHWVPSWMGVLRLSTMWEMERLLIAAWTTDMPGPRTCPDHGHARMGGVRHSGAHQAT
jgi:hypothetical protein